MCPTPGKRHPPPNFAFCGLEGEKPWEYRIHIWDASVLASGVHTGNLGPRSDFDLGLISLEKHRNHLS